MTTKTYRLFKMVALFATFSLSIITPTAHAVFIDFDDLTYVPEYPEWPFFADTPVTNQYESQGLVINDGYLQPYRGDTANDPDFISGPNYLLGGYTLTLNFVGDLLPTHVGMYVGSRVDESIYLDAWGASGLLDSKHTAGFGGPFDDVPYIPRQYITFDSAEGISRIFVWGFFGSRTSAYIDDLTFTYAQAEVPEPSPFILLVMGIAALSYRRLKAQK
ncbi:MAG: PEP-CTERM sorting domain-containing protein [Gammaproteobacteria bacterium]|nr:MAG: PEP-CTERM sorting domain-containing protein [Gammaproteobacteria bacterium]